MTSEGQLRFVLRATLALLVGCATPTFDPPDFPPHDESHEGSMHARRYESPFSCGDPSAPNSEHGVTCSSARPADDLLSCDASGCHGSYTFDSGGPGPSERHLRGSEGPSCYTCHGKEWE